MRLYFFRHGIAEFGEDKADALRALTSEGIEKTKTAAKTLDALGVCPTHLFASPLVRARQTADLLAETFRVPVEIRDALAPGFAVPDVETITAALDREASVMFVGHEPDLSLTVAGLIGGGELILKKGGLARVDVTGYQPMRGALVWLIAPKIFERGKH